MGSERLSKLGRCYLGSVAAAVVAGDATNAPS